MLSFDVFSFLDKQIPRYTCLVLSCPVLSCQARLCSILFLFLAMFCYAVLSDFCLDQSYLDVYSIFIVG
jgi:hypothetical protein